MVEKMKAAPQHAAPTADVRMEDGRNDKKKRSSRLKRWQKVLIGVCGGLLALIVIVVLAAVIMINVGRSELLDVTGEDQSYLTIEHEGRTYDYNQDMVSIGVIGSDRLYGYGQSTGAKGQADAIILLAYNTSNAEVHLINVPRNLVLDYTIDVPNAGPTKFNNYIAAAYGLYAENDAGGSQNVCGVLSTLLGGVPVDNYVTLLESAIGPLTEAMGGVELTAIQDVSWVGIKKGETYRLQGEQALRYVQWRNIHKAHSPADRMERQRHFADAFIKQSIEAIKKDPSVLLDFYSIITNPDYMTTNLDLPELAYLVSTVLNNGVGDFDLTQIPYEDTFNEETGMSEYYAKDDELTQLILDIYYNPIE